MHRQFRSAGKVGWFLVVCAAAGGLSAGCRTASAPPDEATVRAAVERYAAHQSDELVRARCSEVTLLPGRSWRQSRAEPSWTTAVSWAPAPRTDQARRAPEGDTPFTLGMFNFPQRQTTPPPTSEPTAPAGKRAFVPPEGYWRQDIWHQMGHEALSLGQRDFWRGFKSSFWDLPNVLLLTATMGGSVTIRETGVDDTIRNRTHGSRALGDMDETIQILGHPATHFAATGVLWLVSDLTKDVKEHEVAKALTQGLAVNGVTTLLLKASTNTRTPDGEHFGWPSGHTSSAFTAAAVLNQYYGPWVGVPSFALAGLVGYQRIDSRVHDFSDVVFGAMLGYVIGTSVARDDKAQFPELFGMKVIPYIEPESGSAGLALLKQL
jgi:membrane-associated phospholipid phosphatase